MNNDLTEPAPFSFHQSRFSQRLTIRELVIRRSSENSDLFQSFPEATVGKKICSFYLFTKELTQLNSWFLILKDVRPGNVS